MERRVSRPAAGGRWDGHCRERPRSARETGTSAARGESIPGGVLEVGETLRQAAVREAREETGLIVETGELLGVFDRVLRDETGSVRYHYVLIDFLCKRTAGELVAAGDAAEARWFSAEEVAQLPLPEDTAAVVREALLQSS